jgi:hypothetical protein
VWSIGETLTEEKGGTRRKTCSSATLFHHKIDTSLQFVADARYQFSDEGDFACKSHGKYSFIYKEREEGI